MIAVKFKIRVWQIGGTGTHGKISTLINVIAFEFSILLK